MNNKTLAALSPLCLCLVAMSARADLEPFSFEASEKIKHETNINHTSGAPGQGRIADWISATEFSAALKEPLGRSTLQADAGVNYDAYKREHSLNSWGYHAGVELDWETIGDLSGALGADSSRRRYIDGVTADPLFGQPGQQPETQLNMQTDSHVFGRIELGGPSRWQIFAGADATKRRFSSDAFQANNENQWSSNFGTRYATSPDLRFGVVGTYSHGEFPRAGSFVFGNTVQYFSSKFNTRSYDGTVTLQATGNSAFDASLGYTTESSDSLTKELGFLNGSLNWTWTPPSHFTVKLGLKRSADLDTQSAGLNTGTRYVNSLSGPSIDNMASLDVSYELTAKISLEADASYSHRKYSDLQVTNTSSGAIETVNGTLRSTSFYLSAHYKPTRTTDLSCGGGHEQRSAGGDLATFGYVDNTIQCTASIRFE